MSDPMQYFILENDAQKGPFTKGDVLQMLEKGEIGEGTPYATPDMAEWKAVSELRKAVLKESNRRADQVVNRNMWIVLLVAATSIGVWAWWTGNAPVRAGKAAAAYVCEMIPGDEEKCQVVDVEEDRTEYVVRLQVDGKNAMGGWVRKGATVKLSKPGFTVIDCQIDK